MKKVILIFFLLTACGLSSRYQKPDTPLPERFSEEKDGLDVDITTWWENFNDPLLNDLIKQATADNFDLKIAYEKIRESRALFMLEKSNLFPEVDLIAHQKRSRISQSQFTTPFLGPALQDFFQVGFDAAWEIDIFGKIRSEKRAAFYSILSDIENKNDILISLLAEVAKNYVKIRSLQNQIDITQEHISAQEDILSLAQDKFSAGLINDLEINEIESSLQSLKASLMPLKVTLKDSIYTLAILLGKQPEGFDDTFRKIAPLPSFSNKVPDTLPSDLLRKRPDIRKAERDLQVAFAKVKSAVADLFPRFFLLGGYGYESNKSNLLFKSRSRFWSIGPFFSWPILDFGRTRANIRAENSKQKQALLQYEKTILTSLKDVENGLVSYFEEEKRSETLQKDVEIKKDSKNLYLDLYESGSKSILEVLEAEKELFSSEKNFIQSQEILGTNPQGAYNTVSERIAAATGETATWGA